MSETIPEQAKSETSWDPEIETDTTIPRPDPPHAPHLPTELWQCIIVFCPPETWISLRLTCRLFNRELNPHVNPYRWLNFVETRWMLFNRPPNAAELGTGINSEKEEGRVNTNESSEKDNTPYDELRITPNQYTKELKIAWKIYQQWRTDENKKAWEALRPPGEDHLLIEGNLAVESEFPLLNWQSFRSLPFEIRDREERNTTTRGPTKYGVQQISIYDYRKVCCFRKAGEEIIKHKTKPCWIYTIKEESGLALHEGFSELWADSRPWVPGIRARKRTEQFWEVAEQKRLVKRRRLEGIDPVGSNVEVEYGHVSGDKVEVDGTPQRKLDSKLNSVKLPNPRA